MQRFAIFCLCISYVWASPLQGSTSKKVFLKDIGSRIINGDQAVLGQIPWQAALRATGAERSWFCGGSIISDEWILTAGHCVDGAISGMVSTGLINLDGNVGTVSDVSEFILHEEYNLDTVANDIGLARLSSPLTFDENTAPITLSGDFLEADVTVQTSGWGLTSDNGTAVSPTLNYLQLVTVTNEECSAAYGPFAIRDEMVCATSDTNEVKTTCNGDSGGPLVINVDTDPVHVAIVSFVSDFGCSSGAPSGYTRTGTYREWITEKTGV